MNRLPRETAQAIEEQKEKYQPVCKPGSVRPRRTSRPGRDGHSSGTGVAAGLKQPTRTAGPETAPEGCPSCRSYSVLLPVGFAVPRLLPGARWALAPPFHPYPLPSRRGAVCFLWHFPWGRPRRALPGTVFPRSPDFPHAPRARAAVRPAGVPYKGILVPRGNGL